MIGSSLRGGVLRAGVLPAGIFLADILVASIARSPALAAGGGPASGGVLSVVPPQPTASVNCGELIFAIDGSIVRLHGLAEADVGADAKRNGDAHSSQSAIGKIPVWLVTR